MTMARLCCSSAVMTLLIALLAGIPAPAKAATPCELGPGSPATVPEIKPGFLKGYLEKEAMANALALLDAPPRPGSAAHLVTRAMAGSNREQASDHAA